MSDEFVWNPDNKVRLSMLINKETSDALYQHAAAMTMTVEQVVKDAIDKMLNPNPIPEP